VSGSNRGTAPGGPAGDAAALEAALAAAGLPAGVVADGSLALVAADPDTFAGADARAAATRLARAHGFTHAALVLDGGPG
jgi:hypothetical protein